MSSAANPKHDQLEQEFRSRMHEAEAKPSPDLWARIDHELTLKESAGYKKRMIWYRQLAAACIVMLIAAGGIFIYHLKNDQEKRGNLAGTGAGIATGTSTYTAAGIKPETIAASKSAAKHITVPVVSASEEDLPSSVSSARAMPTTKAGIALPQQVVPITAETDNRLAEPSVSEGKYTIMEVPAIILTDNILTSKLEKNIFAEARGNSFSQTTRPEAVLTSPLSFFRTAKQAISSVPDEFTNELRQVPVAAARQQILVNPTVTEMLPHDQRDTHKQFIANARDQQKQQQALAHQHTASDGGEEKRHAATAKKRWVAGVTYAPSYFDQNIGIPAQVAPAVTMQKAGFIAKSPAVSSESSENMQEAQNEFEQNTDPAFSFAVDLKAAFRIGKKWKLFSGLGFTQNTARTRSSYIIKQFWLKPRTNEREELSPEPVFISSLDKSYATDSMSVDKTDGFYVNYRYRHLTLPIGVQYEGRLGKAWNWFASGGVAANLLLETSVMASNDDVKDVHYTRTDNSPFRKMQMSGNLSVGVARRISDNISVTAGPEFRGYFDTMLSDPEKALAPQGRPYTIGLNMGVNYDFGNKK